MDDLSGCGLTSEVSTGERESTPCFAASVALPGARAPSQHSEGLSHFSVLKTKDAKSSFCGGWGSIHCHWLSLSCHLSVWDTDSSG